MERIRNMTKAGNNSGKGEEGEGAKGKKAKNNKESNTNKGLDSITCKICKTIFTANYLVVTDVSYGSAYYVHMLLMQVTSFYQVMKQMM